MNANLLPVARIDASLLLTAAETDWNRPVPHCPEWDLTQLVQHTGGVLAWMGAVVTARQQIARRTLPPAPAEPAELPVWYSRHLAETLHLLATTDPATETWTFSSLEDRRVDWWSRRLAVEVAVHRWDAQYAAARGDAPDPIDGDVAAAGIEEFLTEFLPNLLSRAGDSSGLSGTLHLHATDGPTEWFVDLDHPQLTTPDHRKADSALRGTRSDLLLWLTNREPASLDISGEAETLAGWSQLKL